MYYEIWLGEHYSHFEQGLLHRDDGRTVALKGWIHSATYGPDTILIVDEEHYFCMDFPVRWYIEENGLSFYGWDEDITSVLFHNESSKDLDVSGFGVIKSGETREILRTSWW